MNRVFTSIAASARAPGRTRSATLALAALGLANVAAAPPADDTALTIYSSAQPGGVPAEYYRPSPGGGTPSASGVPGFAMVRHERRMRIEGGSSTLRFTDVAALIDPTTVTFTSLSDPSTRVLEQNFQFDLVSTDKLLQRYVDREVVIERGANAPAVSGTLLSASDGLVVRGADGSLNALREYSGLKFPQLPGGLITRPTLEWNVSAPKAGEQRTRVTYQTGGITWWADYNLIFAGSKDVGSGTLDLAAWVSIINQSGASYPESRLKLIAGDVNRAPVAPSPRVMMAMAEDARVKRGGFAEQSFDEFHLYTLDRRTSLPNNSTKQIELFDQARKVPAKRLLVYRGAPQFGYGAEPQLDRGFGFAPNTKVDSLLEFRNDKAGGLGLPLPAGRVRVSRLDANDGSLEFIGEDVIGHTPRNETLRLKLGTAFDVVGERKQVDFSVNNAERWADEEFTIELRNHKDEAVDVQVLETLYRWTSWRIVSSSLPSKKEDAGTVSFAAKVPKDGATTVRYRVRYSW
ncbi:MAG: DUF4139 domain-containing protein [Steroidobacteraceae bacterium]